MGREKQKYIRYSDVFHVYASMLARLEEFAFSRGIAEQDYKQWAAKAGDNIDFAVVAAMRMKAAVTEDFKAGMDKAKFVYVDESEKPCGADCPKCGNGAAYRKYEPSIDKINNTCHCCSHKWLTLPVEPDGCTEKENE